MHCKSAMATNRTSPPHHERVQHDCSIDVALASPNVKQVSHNGVAAHGSANCCDVTLQKSVAAAIQHGGAAMEAHGDEQHGHAPALAQ